MVKEFLLTSTRNTSSPNLYLSLLLSVIPVCFCKPFILIVILCLVSESLLLDFILSSKQN
jgi:hypothetical protein